MHVLKFIFLFFFFSATCCAKPLSIGDVIDPDGTLAAVLSPDTRHIAAIIFNNETFGLILIETGTGQVKTLVQGKLLKSGDRYLLMAPRRVAWAGNDVLVVDNGLLTESINLKGTYLASLGESLFGTVGRNGDSGKVLVYKNVYKGQMALCEARTGLCTGFEKPPGVVIKWAFDKLGTLRAVTTIDSGLPDDAATVTNWYRPDGQSTWTQLATFKVSDDFWMPAYVPDEAGTLVIRSRAGRDTYALFNYDVATRQPTDMVAGHPTQDLVSWNGIDQETFDYVATEGMRMQQIWFDAAWDRAQQQVDGLLPAPST